MPASIDGVIQMTPLTFRGQEPYNNCLYIRILDKPIGLVTHCEEGK